LPGVKVEQLAQYSDVVFEWLKSYDYQRVGMTMIDTINIDTWPNAKDSTSIVFFDVGILEELDSCDSE
jgi:hypothetical protein